MGRAFVDVPERGDKAGVVGGVDRLLVEGRFEGREALFTENSERQCESL